MTYDECVLASIKANGPSKVHTAWDFGSFYLFSMAPLDWPKGETYDTGTIFTAVDKKTGRASEYDITSDLDSFLKAKVIYDQNGRK